MARQEKTIHYIYKTTCLVTSRYYIGMHSTSKLEDSYLGSGKRLRYSIRKYGKENHIKEILNYFETRDLLIEAETKTITLDMITDKNCMNLMSGGTGGFISFEICSKAGKIGGKAHGKRLKTDLIFRENFLKEVSIIMKNNYKKGKTNLVKDKCDWTNRKHSEDSKQLISETKQGHGTGKTNSQYGTCWITRDNVCKKINKKELKTYQQEGWVKGRK